MEFRRVIVCKLIYLTHTRRFVVYAYGRPLPRRRPGHMSHNPVPVAAGYLCYNMVIFGLVIVILNLRSPSWIPSSGYLAIANIVSSSRVRFVSESSLGKQQSCWKTEDRRPAEGQVVTGPRQYPQCHQVHYSKGGVAQPTDRRTGTEGAVAFRIQWLGLRITLELWLNRGRTYGE